MAMAPKSRAQEDWVEAAPSPKRQRDTVQDERPPWSKPLPVTHPDHPPPGWPRQTRPESEQAQDSNVLLQDKLRAEKDEMVTSDAVAELVGEAHVRGCVKKDGIVHSVATESMPAAVIAVAALNEKFHGISSKLLLLAEAQLTTTEVLTRIEGSLQKLVEIAEANQKMNQESVSMTQDINISVGAIEALIQKNKATAQQRPGEQILPPQSKACPRAKGPEASLSEG